MSSNYVTSASAKLYACPEDVVVHLQDINTGKILLTVIGAKGRDLRFSMPTDKNRDTIYGILLREWKAASVCKVRFVAKVDDHHEELCRLALHTGRMVRIELLGETP